MKKILLTLVCLLSALSLLGVPAKPGSFKYTQPDGSVITLWRHGDEFGHWLTDNQGRVVRKDASGFYRVDATADLASLRRAALAKRQQANRQRRTRRGTNYVAFGKKHFLVILVEFADLSFASSDAQSAFSNMMNQEKYSVNGATGSARDYYFENSKGAFEPVFDVYGPVTLSQEMAYYGGNDSSGDDKHPEEAVVDACRLLDGQIDFTRYDNDGDGNVDLVFMYYAGHGEADYHGDDAEDTIWPHQWALSSGGKELALDGVTIDSYACSNELDGFTNKMVGIGTACHEFGHAMGLPDFYDPDYDENGECGGLYDFSLMCGGSYNNDGRTPPYFNIEERILLGWLDDSAYEDITESGNYVLPSIQSDKAFRTATDQEGEYFVYECRTNTGWDAGLPAHGMIVYHVDKSDRTVAISGISPAPTAASLWSNWNETNSINENGSHPCFYVVSAYDQENLMFGYEYVSGYGYYFDPKGKGYALQMPFPGSEGVTDFTAKSWNGVSSSVSLSRIAYDDSKVTFTASVAKAGLDYPVIRNPQQGTYVTGGSLDLVLDVPEGMSVSSVAWSFDDQPTTAGKVTFTQAGDHTVEATVTLTDGRVLLVTLDIHVDLFD